jgi:plastocyanin
MRALTRRSLLAGAGGALSWNLLPGRIFAQASDEIVEVHMKSDPGGAVVGFDPVGVFLQPGQTVRWICDANVHTTTAYSPKNDNRSLRIPETAAPWASDFLLPGQTFEVKLTVEGVYDYFCAPHEMAGMVGRLIVGKAVGPGSLPFDYFAAQGRAWMPVPPAAQKAFPTVAEIERQRIVHSQLNFST